MATPTFYSYRAIDNKTKKNIRGRIEAPSEIALEQILSETNLTLVSAKRIVQSKLSEFLSLSRINVKDMISLFISLEQMQKAGVPLMDTLKDLRDYSEKPRLKNILQTIYEDVKNGDLLSIAMAKHPRVFNELVTSLVAMGEKTGNLDRSFKNIYEHMKWNYDIKNKTVKAIKGPLFSLLLLLGIAIVLLRVVVPKVLGFILEQEIEIPAYTTALIATSDFMGKYLVFIIGIIVALFVTIKIMRKVNKRFKIFTDKIKTKIPILGGTVQKIELSKFTKFFGTSFSSGIHVLECISIANNVVQNAYVRDEIEIIKQKVSSGKTVAKAVSESVVFPFIVVRMFKVGEESGNVEESMRNIEYFYDMEINDAIDNVVGAIKPLMLFFIGGLLTWVIAAVFGPIYGNFANMQF
ncbi:MAG: type II secretion system F family protein [Rickettsiales bacterium]|jgi:type IV pilus assembly protein PilC|nr:type II secretion system F family protein [Rickettsiales bacterium]